MPHNECQKLNAENRTRSASIQLVDNPVDKSLHFSLLWATNSDNSLDFRSMIVDACIGNEKPGILPNPGSKVNSVEYFKFSGHCNTQMSWVTTWPAAFNC